MFLDNVANTLKHSSLWISWVDKEEVGVDLSISLHCNSWVKEGIVMILQYACKFTDTPPIESKESLPLPMESGPTTVTFFITSRWLKQQPQLKSQPKASINYRTHSNDISQWFQPLPKSHSTCQVSPPPPHPLSQSFHQKLQKSWSSDKVDTLCPIQILILQSSQVR